MAISEHTRRMADELSEAIRSVTSFSAAVTLLQLEDGKNLAPAGWRTGGWIPGDAELIEPAIGDRPGARAVTLGVTLAYSEADNPDRNLPDWAVSRGFTTAIVVPLIKHGKTFGAVYVVRRDPQPPTSEEVNLAELAVVHGSRTLPVLVRRPDENEDEDASSFSMANDELVRDLTPLCFDRLQLDPVREQARLGGVDVSLSRTEFLMLYTLGRQVNEIVPHHALLQACWPEDIPALTAVDATVYRLRKKLSSAETEAGKRMLKTVRGKGYLLAMDSHTGN